MIARARSWKSSSTVSRPSPSSGIRSPKLDSRQWKFSGCPTVMKWLASGPSMKTTLVWSRRMLKIGPCSS